MASNYLITGAEEQDDATSKTVAGFPVHIPSMNISEFQNNPDERVWSGPFTFIHAADPQFGLIEKYFLERENPRWDVEIALTRKAVRVANNMRPKPRFFVVCGDMLDTRPGTKKERGVRQEQYADFVKIFQDLDPTIKLICTCGNHDVCDVPNEETIAIYRRDFGPDYFSFWVGGVKFVVINSQYFKSPETIPDHFEKQMKFLDTIPDPSAKHIVVFQHIPFFIKTPDEDDVSYLNIDKLFRIPLLDSLSEGGVKHVFCGHYHRNATGSYKNIEHVVTSALGGPLGPDPSGFRVVCVNEQKITHEYISLEDDLNANSPVITVSDLDIAEGNENSSPRKIGKKHERFWRLMEDKNKDYERGNLSGSDLLE